MRHLVFIALFSLVLSLWATENQGASSSFQPASETLQELGVEAHKAFRSALNYTRELIAELEDWI
jgi:hypothetical protein